MKIEEKVKERDMVKKEGQRERRECNGMRKLNHRYTIIMLLYELIELNCKIIIDM